MLFFILLFVLAVGGFAQELVQLHPIVGDTIDVTEKKVFYLFPEISDSSFVQGIIYSQDSTYKISITEKGKSNYMLHADSVILNEYSRNIEKLALYYSQLAEVDSSNQKSLSTSNFSKQLNPEFNLDAEERAKLVKDSRRYARKKDRAEDLGLWGIDKENYINSSSHSNIFKAKVRF